MAFTFPLTTTQFMDVLPIRDMVFDLPEAMEVSETGGGEILTADLGTRLWRGKITLADMTSVEADEVMSRLDVLRRTGASFMAHDPRRPGPRLDMDGSLLGASTPTLDAVLPNRRDIRIAGLPPGYALRRHDYIAYSYGTNPVRHALHRLAGQAAANGSGQATVEVSPAIRAGEVPGTAITLLKPACKAIIVPGSVQPGQHKATLTVGVSFDWIQTLR